ncbi:hypothetical protein HanIR_Chr17g0856391 [Helianthus annuus]|nr:hypothetical protein HanIR_Chr17g0856391 [Helianthus annuus]
MIVNNDEFIGLCILVITMIVNICIQISNLIYGDWLYPYGCIRLEIRYTAMMLQLLNIMISSSLSVTTFKEILDFKYQAMNKISANLCLQHI